MADQSPPQNSSRFRTAPPSPTPTRAPVLANPFASIQEQGSPSERYKVNTNNAPSAPRKRKRVAEGKKTKKKKTKKTKKIKKK